MANRTRTRYIVIHHTGSENSSLQSIETWHKQQGWGGIGYHAVIDYDGVLTQTRHWDAVGVHSLNNNHHSYGVAVMGDFRSRPPSGIQLEVLIKHLAEAAQRWQNAEIVGHGHLNNTTCPGQYMPVDWIREAVPFMNMFKAGIVKSPEDSRDWQILKAFPLLGTVSIPRVYRIPYNPKTKDQRERGTCGGFAMAYIKEVNEMLESIGLYQPLSPLAIYLEARALDAALIPPDSDGVTMRSLAKVAVDYGAPHEASFPYNTTFSNTDRPPERLNGQAWRYRTKGYVRCNTLDEIKRSIAIDHPVAIGLYLLSNFTETINGVVPWEDNKPYFMLGGHAMMAFAYDDDRQLLGCKQSYGEKTRYADKDGITWFPYRYVETVLHDIKLPILLDAFSMIDFIPQFPPMPKTLTVADGDVHVLLDGKPVDFKYMKPVIIKELGRTIFSLRDIAEISKLHVDYDEKTNTVILTTLPN